MEENKITIEHLKKAAEYIYNNKRVDKNKEVTLDVDIKKALDHIEHNNYSVCKITQKEGMLFGVFEGGVKIRAGAAGMLNIFDMMPISGWTVYYNGVKLHEEGKEEFYLFLENYVKKS